MIHVIASIHHNPERRAELLEIYRDFVPQVIAEKGCIRYQPTFDLPTDLPNQQRSPEIITVIEQWESLEAFHAHLDAPHVIAYRERTQGIVTKVTVQVLQEA